MLNRFLFFWYVRSWFIFVVLGCLLRVFFLVRILLILLRLLVLLIGVAFFLIVLRLWLIIGGKWLIHRLLLLIKVLIHLFIKVLIIWIVGSHHAVFVLFNIWHFDSLWHKSVWAYLADLLHDWRMSLYKSLFINVSKFFKDIVLRCLVIKILECFFIQLASSHKDILKRLLMFTFWNVNHLWDGWNLHRCHWLSNRY